VSATGQKTNRWPQVLPGSHAVLFNAYQTGDNPDDAEIQIFSFKTGERKTVEHGYFARYLRSGHLVFLRQNTLFAAPFDISRLAVIGPAQPVLDDVSAPAFSGAANFDLSQTGTFVYLAGAGANRAIFWLDSAGNLKPLHTEPGQYYHPAFSPDGKHLAFTVASGHGMDIWVQDLARGDASRKSFLPGRNWWPLWIPDGKGIVFASAGGEVRDTLYFIAADGSGEAQQISDENVRGIPRSFSPDGTRLAFDTGPTVSQIWTVPMKTAPEHPRLGAASRFIDAATPVPDVQFSPDGRWIAYVSAESGMANIFVRPFPGPGGTAQVSTGGGRFPIWSRNGQLFYLGPDKRIQVATYTTSSNSFSPGKSRVWSQRQLGDWGVNRMYDLAPDGKRFAVILDTDQTGDSKPAMRVTVLVNFFDELRRRVPLPRP
jgi:serine/threonine-protein kinase